MRGLSKSEKHAIKKAVRTQLDRIGKFTGCDFLRLPWSHRRTAMQELRKRTNVATHHDARFCKRKYGFFSDEVQG